MPTNLEVVHEANIASFFFSFLPSSHGPIESFLQIGLHMLQRIEHVGVFGMWDGSILCLSAFPIVKVKGKALFLTMGGFLSIVFHWVLPMQGNSIWEKKRVESV